MTKITFITSKKLFQNSIFFLTPLIVWKNFLHSENIFVEVKFYENLKLHYSDFIFVDSKVHRNILDNDFEKVSNDFDYFKKKSKYIFYCDTGDSSCWIEKKIFPLVDKYLKCQLLKDKNLYKMKMYGKKINSDFYHRNLNINDNKEIWSDELTNDEIDKLDLSWNIFFSNHNLLSPLNHLIMKFFKKNIIVNKLFFSNPHKKRTNDFFIKFSHKNYYPTIGWQRKKILEIFDIHQPEKFNKFKYFNLMKSSRYCVSPFGWGEIAIRDFEAFVSGCVLIKPDMSHLKTWPDLYIPNLSYIPIKWNLSDLEKNLEHYKGNYSLLVNIAREGQKIYKSHTQGVNAGINFAKKIKELISI